MALEKQDDTTNAFAATDASAELNAPGIQQEVVASAAAVEAKTGGIRFQTKEQLDAAFSRMNDAALLTGGYKNVDPNVALELFYAKHDL